MTRRELEVLRLVAIGYGDRPISMILGVSPSTAASHVKSIVGKLGATNRSHACYLAQQQGLLRHDGIDIHVP